MIFPGSPCIFVRHNTLFADGELCIYLYMHLVRDKNIAFYFYYTSLELEISLDFGFHPIC